MCGGAALGFAYGVAVMWRARARLQVALDQARALLALADLADVDTEHASTSGSCPSCGYLKFYDKGQGHDGKQHFQRRKCGQCNWTWKYLVR